MADSFETRMNGLFYGMVGWHHLEALWGKVRQSPEGWYVSMVGEAPGESPLAGEALEVFIAEMDALLRRDHDYDYCGIVYADDPAAPTFIKIYDPNHLGSACGSSGGRILPRWLLTRIKPEKVAHPAPLPAARQRWWQALFG